MVHHGNECGCGRHHGQPEESRMHHGGGCGCSHHQGGEKHHGGEHDCQCGCHHREGIRHAPGAGRFERRRFFSQEEMIARLEEYLKQLLAEAKGVEERLAELKQKEG